MDRHYAPLGAQLMRAGTIVTQPALNTAARVAPEDPAVSAMTDLTRVAAVLVDPDVDIEAAMRIMIRRNVRSLFAVNVENEVLGLITATDLLGEKPLQHIQRYGVRRNEMLVRDLMTPRAQLEVLRMRDVERARIGHIVETLRQAGRQHAMVVDDAGGERPVVRGVFSTTQIEKQLGHPVPVGVGAHSFAEIEAALAR